MGNGKEMALDKNIVSSHKKHMGPVWFCNALVNSDILTVYYGVKQSQFTKPTPEPLH